VGRNSLIASESDERGDPVNSSDIFNIWQILFCIGIFGLMLYFWRYGRWVTVTLLPYQQGVLYKRGEPIRDCGTGRHRVRSGIEMVIHLDVRPISITYENRVVSLRDGHVAAYGVSASAQVRDVRKALYSARNYAQVPPIAVLRCARKRLGAHSSDSLRSEQNAIASQITEEIKARLDESGFELLSFRLTQLVIGTLRSTGPEPTQALPQQN
jgi:SPFH domain / Band 7 family